jgi:hypothetical protein
MIDNSVVISQNCMDLLKVEPGSCSETSLTSSRDGSQEVTNVQEEDPLQMFPVIKAEHEVQCICVCVDMHVYLSIIKSISQISRIALLFLISLSFYMK